MTTQIALAQLILLLSAALFYRNELLPAAAVLAVYITTLIMVIRKTATLNGSNAQFGDRDE